MVIKTNKVKCLRCGDILQSLHRHDFRLCSCGQVAVDGGTDYMRRMFNRRDDYEELSEYSMEDDGKE